MTQIEDIRTSRSKVVFCLTLKLFFCLALHIRTTNLYRGKPKTDGKIL